MVKDLYPLSDGKTFVNDEQIKILKEKAWKIKWDLNSYSNYK